MDLSSINFAVERGFTSLPKKVIWTLPVSSGAKLTLIALCEMAHGVTGHCSMYLDTLGAMLGKARSTISGYVKELRELGVLQVKQLVRKGFHDRCEFTVTFYARFREQLRSGGLPDNTCTGESESPSPAQVSERGVQHSECKKNNRDFNKTTTASHEATVLKDVSVDQPVAQVVDDLIDEWQQQARGLSWSQPVPASEDLVERTHRFLSQNAKQPQTSHPPALPDVQAWIWETWKNLDVTPTREQVAEHAEVLRILGKRTDFHRILENLRKDLQQTWNPNWKRPSTQQQFQRSVEAALRDLPPTTEVKRSLLKSFLKRTDTALA